MRFPWLQVDSDFIAAHAADLAAHLDITRREAIGLAVDLWTWTLARASDDAPPDGLVTGTGPVPDRLLAGSVGWTGPVAQLVEGLLAVGLVSQVDGGYRIAGIERYKATWEKNKRRPKDKPDRNRTGTGPEPTRKTQTQTHIEDSSVATASDSKSPAFSLKPTRAEKVRKPSEQERLAALISQQRQELLGPDVVPDPYPLGRLNKMCLPLVDVDPELLRKGHAAFCQNEYALSRSPPAPLWLFCQEWAKWVDIARRGAA